MISQWINSTKALVFSARRMIRKSVCRPATAAVSGVLAVFLLTAPRSIAMYNFDGQGMQTVVSGSVANASLYMNTLATWLNTPWNPAVGQPYNVPVSFALPPCGNIVNGRLILTLWGGEPQFTANLSVSVNSNALVVGGLNFGGTSDTNVSFSGTQPSVYGSGYGTWVVALPVSNSYLHTDGSSNLVSVTVTTTNEFDGRIFQVTLLSVYQQSALSNQFQYAIAEGSGDIYNAPSSGEVCSRTVALGGLSLPQVNSAAFQAVYIYGQEDENNLLVFNGVQLGGDDVANWVPPPDYGPSVVGFDVTPDVVSTNNSVVFDLCSADVPPPVVAQLDPEIAVLTASGPELSPWQQWQMLYFKCTGCPQAQPNADPYGKGISNTNQFLLGLNPTDPASFFGIIAISRASGTNTVKWNTSGGDLNAALFGGPTVITNIVQGSVGTAAGGYSNNFSDISGPMIILPPGNTVTNYPDASGTNRFYRIRLGP
jgi:hypothetical protein